MYHATLTGLFGRGRLEESGRCADDFSDGAEAQARFVELMEKVGTSETVLITEGVENRVVARLVKVAAAGKRLGFMETHGWDEGAAFWEPLPEEELRLWNGEGE